jgi:hypothetical protein
MIQLGYRCAQTFVCEVVSKAKDELGRVARSIAVIEYQPLCDLPLVHEPWANFEVGFARHDFDIVLLADSIFKGLLTLTSLECTILGISSSVVPRQSNLLPLDERSCPVLVWFLYKVNVLTLRSLSVVLEDVHNFRLPAHIRLVCETLPLFAVRMTHEATMLST